MKWAKIAVNSLLRKFGYELTLYSPNPLIYQGFPTGYTEEEQQLWYAVKDFTMTSPQRVISLREAARFVTREGIPGDFVECGVWRGGCALAMALVLMELGDTSRHIYLYDTFEEGWPQAEAVDIDRYGKGGHEYWVRASRKIVAPDDLVGSYDGVRRLILDHGFPEERLHTIRGKVEDTIPGTMPERIAVLRLDTDWYASTMHELTHLFPRLSTNGVLVLDDYDEWQGARKAVDEYMGKQEIRIHLHRVEDAGSRIALKL